jgi:hypothetical protein
MSSSNNSSSSSSSSSSSINGSGSVAAAETTFLTPEAVVEQLRVLQQQIPDFTQMPARARAILRAAHVDPAFAHAAINTIGASDTMQVAVGRKPEELFQDETEIARWTAVEDELRKMLKGCSAANLRRRHRLGLTALQTYGISQQLVRSGEHENLQTHVEGMQRMKKFARRSRSKTTVEPPAPAPIQPQK